MVEVDGEEEVSPAEAEVDIVDQVNHVGQSRQWSERLPAQERVDEACRTCNAIGLILKGWVQ